jgi:hypothetical protein
LCIWFGRIQPGSFDFILHILTTLKVSAGGASIVAATATTAGPALSVTATNVGAGGSVLLASTDEAAGSGFKLIDVRDINQS